MSRYKVCVYAICRDEAKFANRWMDSMSEADLVVVTDTGSRDCTPDILRRRGAVVFEQTVTPWRFDTARNISLDNVPEDADICVCTDLDETFEPGWREKLERAWREPGNDGESAKMGRYLYNWRLKPDGTPDVQFMYFKIHSRQGFRWVYPVHEVLRRQGKPPGSEVYIDGLTLNHRPDPEKSRGSYLELLELGVKEALDDPRMRYYLGREYMYSGRWRDCAETLSAYLKLKGAAWNQERCAAMRWIALSYRRLGFAGEAYRWYYRAVAEAPGSRDAYIELAQMCCELADWPTALAIAEDALCIKNRDLSYVSMGCAWDHTPDSLCAQAAHNMGLTELAKTHAESANAVLSVVKSEKQE